MGRFLFVFFLTLVIGFFSTLLSVVAAGFLFFGKYASFPAPESVSYWAPRLITWAITLFPGILFIWWQAKRESSWISWFGGLLALGIAQVLFWGGMMNFRMIG